MTMLFCDSFAHYATAEAQYKYTTVGASGFSIEATDGRRGSPCMKTTGTGGYVIASVRGSPTELIVGVAYKPTAVDIGTNRPIRLMENGTDHVCLGHNAAGAIVVYRSTTSIATSAVGVISAGAWHYIELRAKMSDTVGEVEVRVNGVLVLTATGSPAALDTLNGGTGAINLVGLYGSNTGGAIWFGDLVIMDTTGSRNNDFLGDVRVEAYRANGNGTTSDFDGSDGDSTNNYLLVDDTTPDTGSPSTYVESSTVGDVDLYDMQSMSHNPDSIFAVQIVGVLSKVGDGSRSANLVTRRSGTNYTTPAVALPDGYRGVTAIVETDPAAASPNDWTQTNLNAAEFGVKVAA